MKYTTLTFLMLLLCQSAFSQSKKEQIEILIYQKDSLGRVLEKERQLNSDQVKLLETKISKINSDMGLIQKELAQSKKELTQSKKELATKEEEILGHQLDHVLREDTIRSLREELHQIKASNFETFLPYFISQAIVGKGFEYFVDGENIGYGVFTRPGVWCGGSIDSFAMDTLSHDDFTYFNESWLLPSQNSWGEDYDLSQISRLPYFRNKKPDVDVCNPEDTRSPDGIYFYEVNSLPEGVIGFEEEEGDGDGVQYSTTPSKLKNLKKIRTQVQYEKRIIKDYHFIEYNKRWYLVSVDDCYLDCGT
jgi:hypothetical protein